MFYINIILPETPVVNSKVSESTNLNSGVFRTVVKGFINIHPYSDFYTGGGYT